ncbi:hypothetical protein GCM10008110_06180 [Marinobacter persicus]|nr:hypothetical protein GCM10008110_06180 [Marinobacter persicus]
MLWPVPLVALKLALPVQSMVAFMVLVLPIFESPIRGKVWRMLAQTGALNSCLNALEALS